MNADDIFAELAAVREFIARRDYRSALQAVEQAQKLWSAERDYWAWVELEQARYRDTAASAKNTAPPREMPVTWAKRHESIHAQEDDWRTNGIA